MFFNIYFCNFRIIKIRQLLLLITSSTSFLSVRDKRYQVSFIVLTSSTSCLSLAGPGAKGAALRHAARRTARETRERTFGADSEMVYPATQKDLPGI